MDAVDTVVETLRDSELVQWAIIERLQHNGAICSEKDPDSGAPVVAKETTLIQKHEVAKLMQKHQSDSHTIRQLLNLSSKEPVFDEESILNEIKRVIDVSDTKSIQMLTSMNEDETLQDSDNVYRMMTLKKVKQDQSKETLVPVQSQYTSDIHLSKIFTPNESQGKFMDLQPFYNQWLQLPRSKELEEIPNYYIYLKEYLLGNKDTAVIINSDHYTTYLENLLSYLDAFYHKIEPLKVLDLPKEVEQSADMKCKVCSLSFTKTGPMENHLKSKKHLAKLKYNSKRLLLEHQIETLISKYLLQIFNDTLENFQRTSLLTTREYQLEQNDKVKANPKTSPSLVPLKVFMKDSFNLDDSEGQNKSDRIDNNPLNLPLGPDGKPIPFWLFKMRGLRYTFQCEICGNKTFKGRNNFSTHFSSPRHVDGLRMLGIQDHFSDYDDIDSIDEVRKLVELKEREKLDKKKWQQDVEQVEVGEEGDVMGAEVYEQLKKQGLV